METRFSANAHGIISSLFDVALKYDAKYPDAVKNVCEFYGLDEDFVEAEKMSFVA